MENGTGILAPLAKVSSRKESPAFTMCDPYYGS